MLASVIPTNVWKTNDVILNCYYDKTYNNLKLSTSRYTRAYSRYHPLQIVSSDVKVAALIRECWFKRRVHFVISFNGVLHLISHVSGIHKEYKFENGEELIECLTRYRDHKID